MNKEKMISKLVLEINKLKLEYEYWKSTKRAIEIEGKILAYSEILHDIKNGEFDDN